MDPAAAFDWYQRAAALGSAAGAYNLAMTYAHDEVPSGTEETDVDREAAASGYFPAFLI